jgi:hypothetical protein
MMPDWIKQEASFWPRVEAKLRGTEQSDASPEMGRSIRPPFRWQWAWAGLFIVLLAGTILVFHERNIPSPVESDLASALHHPRIKITRAEILGKRAKSFVYQTEENIFIWFDELSQEEN